ncbi:MAG: SLC26A/SulP transporter family protein [Trueperaceae bacterium]|nr:MAG: SLC26A/SulP transporter family protein [Trueperaceae bacterium]
MSNTAIDTGGSRLGLLLPTLVGGLVAGFYVALFMFSYAAVIFTEDLAPFLPSGVGAMLVGSVVISIVMALRSSLPGVIAVPQDNPTAISAVLALAIMQRMPDTASPADAFTTLLVGIGLTTLLTGVVFMIIGRFKLANLVRFIPYPVIGGFLAGTGWLLFQGGFIASADVSLTFGNLALLFQPGVLKLWLPALAFGTVLFAVLNRYSHYLIMPSIVAASLAIFYAGLALSGTSLEQAVAQGWLLEPLSGGGLFKPLTPADVLGADWGILFGQLGTVLTIVLVSTISVLLNITALETGFQRDIDMNRELQFTGLGNVIAAFGGSVVGYHYVGMSVLEHKMKADSRLVGVIIAAVCGIVLLAGPAVVALLPKFILGGLAVFIGLAFLYDWVYQGFKKLSRLDMAIILGILVAIVTIGFLEGIAVGIIATVALFIFNYSRTSVIRHSVSGASYHSHVDRPAVQRRFLREKGDAIRILTLHGFIFFGTSSTLLQRVREVLDATSPRYLIFDFGKVDGLDTSALHNFVKIRQLVEDRGCTVVYADLSSEVETDFEGESFIDGSPLVPHTFRDLDHAVEWCENRLLEAENIPLSVDEHPLREELEAVFGDARLVEQFAGYLERREVGAGEHLIRQGEPVDDLYFLVAGRVSLQLEFDHGEVHRLRTVAPGAIIGAEGALRQGVHLCPQSIVADEASTLLRLSAEALAMIKAQHPTVAVAFQEFMLHHLAEQVGRTTELVQDLLVVEE